MKIEGINHIALRVKDSTKSADFYRKYCGMEIVHSRQEGDLTVCWIRRPEQDDAFMLVLIERIGQPTEDAAGGFDHLGVYVADRKDIDEIASMARKDGLLVEGPEYSGPILGYYCIVRDPDGNLLEFSTEHARPAG